MNAKIPMANADTTSRYMDPGLQLSAGSYTAIPGAIRPVEVVLPAFSRRVCLGG